MAVNLLENFLSTNSIIQVVTDEVENWKVKTANIKNSQRFSFITPSNLSYAPRFDYVIFCGGFLKQDLAFKDFHKFNSNIKTGGSKTIALFPFETFSRDHMDRIKGNDNTAIIFLGDLLGPRIDLDSDLLLPSLIVKLLNSRGSSRDGG